MGPCVGSRPTAPEGLVARRVTMDSEPITPHLRNLEGQGTQTHQDCLVSCTSTLSWWYLYRKPESDSPIPKPCTGRREKLHHGTCRLGWNGCRRKGGNLVPERVIRLRERATRIRRRSMTPPQATPSYETAGHVVRLRLVLGLPPQGAEEKADREASSLASLLHGERIS